jgi:hypothetical protein
LTFYLLEGMSRYFENYLDKFMKIFLDDFTVYNDKDIHIAKLILCFQICKEIGISLNLNKFVFLVF